MDIYSGFVYIWYDRKKKWFCIGSRFGHTEDGYTTSTGWMKKAYKKRPEDFKRKILEYYYGEDRLELHAMEQKWLDKIKDSELCLNENKINGTIRYYNIKKKARGIGGKYASDLRKEYWDSEKGSEHKKRLSVETTNRNKERKGKGVKPWNKGKKCPSISKGRLENPIDYTEEQIEKRREIALKLWQDPEYKEKMDNRPLPSDELIEKRASFHRGRKRSDETKQNISSSLSGKPKSEEHCKSLSVAAKERSKRSRTCPHCGFVGSGPVMSRWHFSNCKLQAL